MTIAEACLRRMRRNALISLLVSTGSLLLTVCASALAAASPVPLSSAAAAARWRAAVESAPAREVLPVLPQQLVANAWTLPDGDVAVAGTLSTGDVAIAVLRPDGRLDGGFGVGGVELTSVKLQPWQILGLPDGKLLVLGPSRSPGSESPVVRRFPDWQVLRLQSNGAPDRSFGHGGLLDVAGVPVPGEGPSEASLPELSPTGDVILPTLLGPIFSTAASGALVRLRPDGSRDTSFGSGGTLTLSGYAVAALGVAADGSIILATAQSSQHAALVRLNPTGAPDPAFNGGAALQLPLYTVEAMLAQPDGTIQLLGVTAPTRGEQQVWRYTAAGAPDAGWGAGGVVGVGSGVYFTQMLPGVDGTTTLLTRGVVVPAGVDETRTRILTLSSAGSFSVALGGAGGLVLTLPPFAGGTFAPRTIANPHQNTFVGDGAIRRANGGLLFTGIVQTEEAIPTDAGPDTLRWDAGLALAALGPSYQAESSFTGSIRPHVTVAIRSTRLTGNGVAVRLSCSGPATAVVALTAAGSTLARASVAFFARGQAETYRSLRIPLTAAGRRLLHRRVHLTAFVSAVDLAANHLTARASATLRP